MFYVEHRASSMRATLITRVKRVLVSTQVYMSAATATAHSFNKLLSQPKAASKSRATGETDDGTKKLRRMILVEGIPSVVVRYMIFGIQVCLKFGHKQRIQLCVLGYGKYYFELTNYLQRHTLTMSLVAHAKCEKKYEMILLGIQLNNVTSNRYFKSYHRTLATDKGFKGRVQEDMLVRLLDAFVWRSNGMQICNAMFLNSTIIIRQARE